MYNNIRKSLKVFFSVNFGLLTKIKKKQNSFSYLIIDFNFENTSTHGQFLSKIEKNPCSTLSSREYLIFLVLESLNALVSNLSKNDLVSLATNIRQKVAQKSFMRRARCNWRKNDQFQIHSKKSYLIISKLNDIIQALTNRLRQHRKIVLSIL